MIVADQPGATSAKVVASPRGRSRRKVPALRTSVSLAKKCDLQAHCRGRRDNTGTVPSGSRTASRRKPQKLVPLYCPVQEERQRLSCIFQTIHDRRSCREITFPDRGQDLRLHGYQLIVRLFGFDALIVRRPHTGDRRISLVSSTASAPGEKSSK